MVDERLVVSVVQPVLERGGDQNLSRIVSLVKKATATGRTDVVVLPNHLTRSAPVSLPCELTDALADLARDNLTAIVGALPERTEECAYNTAFIIGSDGRLMGVQRKFMLSPVEASSLRPAPSVRVFDTDAARFGVVVGEDILFPDFSRVVGLSGAEVVFCPSLVAGELVRSLRTACCIRAFENRMFVVNANGIPGEVRTTKSPRGQSTIATPYVGDNLLAKGLAKEGIITAELDLARYREEKARPPEAPGKRRGRRRKYRLGPDPHRCLELLGRVGLELEVEIRSVKGAPEE